MFIPIRCICGNVCKWREDCDETHDVIIDGHVLLGATAVEVVAVGAFETEVQIYTCNKCGRVVSVVTTNLEDPDHQWA